MGRCSRVRVVAQREQDGLTVLGHPAGELAVPALDLPIGTSLRLRIDAQDVVLALGSVPLAGISIRNQLRATVAALGAVTDGAVEVGLDVAGERLRARITAASARALGLAPGLPVLALVKSVALGPEHATPLARRRLTAGRDRTRQLEARLQHHVERRLRRAAHVAEAAAGDHLA